MQIQEERGELSLDYFSILWAFQGQDDHYIVLPRLGVREALIFLDFFFLNGNAKGLVSGVPGSDVAFP